MAVTLLPEGFTPMTSAEAISSKSGSLQSYTRQLSRTWSNLQATAGQREGRQASEAAELLEGALAASCLALKQLLER